MSRWPKQDRIKAEAEDMRILTKRGLTVTEAATRLGIDQRTAYRLLERVGGIR